MTKVTIEEAQAKLPELIGGLAQGDELAIMQDDRMIARIVGERAQPRGPRVAGFARGIFTIASEDDDHLADFAEYMP